MAWRWRSLLATTALSGVAVLAATSIASAEVIFTQDDGNGTPIVGQAFLDSDSFDARNTLVTNTLADYTVGINGFETQTAGDFPLPDENFELVLDFGFTTATLTNPAFFPGAPPVLPGFNSGIRDQDVEGRYAVEGDQFLESGQVPIPVDETSAVVFTLVFSIPINAFSFYGTDMGDDGTMVSAIVDGTDTYAFNNNTGGGASANLVHWSIVQETAFTTVELIATGALLDGIGFDSFLAAIPDGEDDDGNGDVAEVPEPGTIALLGAGLLGLGAVRRRRRKA